MIKLKIKNWFEECNSVNIQEFSLETKEFVTIRRIEKYDKEKWKNEAIYEFNTLKELQNFIDTCDICFTEKYAERFGLWDWEEIDLNLYIDNSEDNLMVFDISSHQECRN